MTSIEMGIFSTIFILIASSLLLFIIIFSTLILRIFIGQSIKDPKYPPVKGTVFHQLIYFNRLHDYLAELAEKHPTFRLLAPSQSEIYTTDTRNIEHILKTNFENYSKGKYNQDVVRDLFGQGIFAVDGEKWRHQRKLASFEFSTRVLREFSCAVFRKNAAKLTRTVSEVSESNQALDIQDLLMKCTLDSIFKVGFGIDLNCVEGASKEGSVLMKAFDDSNALVYWRWVDPFWNLKRLLNVGTEYSLRKNLKIVHDFVNDLIKSKRKQLVAQKDHVSHKPLASLTSIITEVLAHGIISFSFLPQSAI